ncbi:hypothetical protein HID58_009518 [Brassica napus]|uniref:Uncharacterized protein n=1 Tax=Brassica napus TaxID=3708 RepID=A0ABQ8DSP6_BRANA|nr:hypothetical protein HID58_009518 [Brassica napus]
MSELQKPKSKRQEEEEEEEGNNVGCREEQEQALVALVEHRSAETERLKHHISNYQAKLIEAERSLRDSKAKLANLRGHDDGVSVPSVSSAKKENPLKTLRNVNDDESTRNVTPSRKEYHNSSLPTSNSSISKSKTNTPVVVKQKPETSSRDSISNSKSKTVVVKQTSSRDSPNLKASRDRDRGTKRKFARNSSPTTIKCNSSNQISSQHKRKLRSLILCPVNEQLFATSSLDGMVSLWQLQPGRLAASLLSTTDCLSQKQRRWGEDMAWHPSGHTLFSVYTADDGDSQISILNLNKTRGFTNVRIFDREPEKQLRLFDIRLRRTELHSFGWKQDSSESQSALINQSWSPDGLYITSGSADPVIHLFDIRYNSRKPTQSIKAHQKRVFKAEWHYSQPLLISISSDLNIGLHKIS